MYNAVLIYHIHSLRSIYDNLQALSLIDGCCCRVVDPGLEAVSGKLCEVKRSGMLEGRMQLEKSLMLWKISVNTYRKLTKFTTGSLGVRAIGVFRFGYLPTRYLCAFVLMLNSCCTAPL